MPFESGVVLFDRGEVMFCTGIEDPVAPAMNALLTLELDAVGPYSEEL